MILNSKKLLGPTRTAHSFVHVTTKQLLQGSDCQQRKMTDTQLPGQSNTHPDEIGFANQEPSHFFKLLYDEAFKFHYNKIINEILAFATFNTPLEYTSSGFPCTSHPAKKTKKKKKNEKK
jgi:hypothetical protein